jgi:small multidrug resistance pump
MTGITFLWLGAATTVFVAANAVLKVYATKGAIPVLIGALALFCLGNWLMVQVMKANGLGLAIALSAIFQLVAISWSSARGRQGCNWPGWRLAAWRWQ